MANDDGLAVRTEMLVLDSDGNYVAQDIMVRPCDGLGAAIETLDDRVD